MPKAFNSADHQEISLRLIAAGRKLINRHGLKKLVVEDVAREAGISKGSFYRFHPSREEFILSVFESWEDEYRQKLLDTMSREEVPATRRLEEFFLGMFDMLEREPGLSSLNTRELGLLMERLPPDRLARHQSRDQGVMETAMVHWLAHGLISQEGSTVLYGLVMAVLAMGFFREMFPGDSYRQSTRWISRALAHSLVPKEAEK